MMPNQPIVRFQSIVLQPHRMQFVIDELPSIIVCAAGWIYGGMEERPFTAFAVSVAVLFSLVLLYRFIYLRRTRYYTDDNRDRYLVRGNKLYPIMKDGINELPLVKISKKQAKIELQDYPFYYNVKD